MILQYLDILWSFGNFSRNHGLQENWTKVKEFLCNNKVWHHSHFSSTHFHWVLFCFPSLAAVLISTCLPFFVLIPTQSSAISTHTNFLMILPANYPVIPFSSWLNWCLSHSQQPLKVPLKKSSDNVPIPMFKSSLFDDIDFSMILLMCSISFFFVCSTLSFSGAFLSSSFH